MKSQKLRQHVHHILHHEWDPIGVKDVADCENEYSGYVSGILRLLGAGADQTKIEAHLVRLQNESMGLPRVSERTNAAATKLADLAKS